MEKKSCTAGLVLGILSLIFWLLPILGLPVSILGIIFGANGLKLCQKYAAGALVCSIIGLAFTIVNSALGAYMAVTGGF